MLVKFILLSFTSNKKTKQKFTRSNNNLCFLLLLFFFEIIFCCYTPFVYLFKMRCAQEHYLKLNEQKQNIVYEFTEPNNTKTKRYKKSVTFIQSYK